MPKQIRSRTVTASEALDALGLLRPTDLARAINPNIDLTQAPRTVAEACRRLKCSRYQLKKAIS